MIALRGELRRDKNSWKWAGVWAFGSLPDGASLATHSRKAKNPSVRPFIYAFNRPRSADSVLVPSANMPEEAPEPKTEQPIKAEKPNANDSSDTVIAHDSNEPMDASPSQDDKVVQFTTSKDKDHVVKLDSEEDVAARRHDDENASPGAVSKTRDEPTADAETKDKETTIKDIDSEQKVKEKDTTNKPTMEKARGGVEKTASSDAQDTNPDEESKNANLESSVTKRIEESVVTYASTSQDEPDYTEASTIHSEKCPADGSWSGYFENVSQRKDRNCSRVQENFCLFFNATPSDDARVLFLDTEESTETAEGAGDTTESSAPSHAKLPPAHVHVRGKGTNQFGTFELLGSLNLETGVLECQRMYVITVDESSSQPSRRRQSVARAPRTKIVTDAGESAATTPRAYNTRKRQLSWRRANLSDDDDDEGTGRRSSSTKKRVRTSDGRKSPVALATLLGTTPKSGGKTTITVPTGSGAKRPMPSPRSAGATPKKRATPNNKSAAAVVPSSHYMKLPAAGDPREARWRAAHFLYYQRNDPSTDEGGASAAASAAPSFVVYEGEMLEGECLRDGRGVCLYSNGTLYEGEWKRNKEHGVGTLMSSDRKRIIYKGEWERGRMHGQGTYYYSYDSPLFMRRNEGKDGSDGGSRYEGDFKENTRHGMGKYVLPNGSIYDGEWRDNVMSGRGTFYWVDGSVYVGQWKDGKRNGQGTLKTSDGFTYDGTWVQNAMEGRGIAKYPNGQRYEGLWVGGRREGRGTIHFTNGSVYEGRFRDDCIEGQGTMKMPSSVGVPRPRTLNDKEEAKDEDGKDDWMIPIHFQSDMGHIHQKAGFTIGGD